MINPNEVHIWWIRTDSPELDLALLESFLSDDEKNRADRFHFPHHRRRFIAAHGCLRSILGCYLDRAPDAIKLLNGPKGKPFLEKTGQDAELHFSLSHSNDVALVGIALNKKIGVDIEHIRALSNMESIAGRYFSENEINQILNTNENDRSQVFFQYWTMKESYLKAMGTGISGLQGIQIPHAKTDTNAQTVCIVDASNTSWSIQPLHPTPGYAAAVAIEGSSSIVTVLRQIPSGYGK
jgi:4'-phosphopantetheinyl transferase